MTRHRPSPMGSRKRFPAPAKAPLTTLAALLVALLAALLAAVPVAAQLTNASTSSLGLAGNDTATVRNFGAISVNPAGLALPGSEFSLAIVPVRIGGGIGPVTLADVKAFEGKLVPAETKERWMERIDAAEGQGGVAAIEVSELALTGWNVGFQLSSLVAADLRLPPSVVEAVLFGNAGRTGTATDVALADVLVEGYATTTAGLSFAVPIPVMEEPLGPLTAGATVKYTVGHAVAVGRSAGTISATTLQADFDSYLIHTRSLFDAETLGDDLLNGGGGLGLDLGLMLVLDRLTVGAAVHDLFNTFAWDESLLTYRRVAASFEDGSFSFEEAEQPFDDAPASAQDLIAELTFKPTVRVGGAYLVLDELTVSSDFHYRFGEGMAVDPSFHVGAGAEYRPLEFLHLRAGLALVTDGFQFGGGLSFILGPVNLSAAVSAQPGGVAAQLGLSFGNR